jgi:hypothetical protein
MGLVPNFEFMRSNTKSHAFFSMLKLSYTKSNVGLFITNFLACPTRISVPNIVYLTKKEIASFWHLKLKHLHQN